MCMFLRIESLICIKGMDSLSFAVRKMQIMQLRC
uniref:Uncharacterized protein n=1 Tax=Cucumis melo TaxID=3656 RepID=A0A9I9CBP5_CUCME